jgi:nicotinamidase-related amidase
MKKTHNIKKKFSKSSRKTRYLLKKKKLTKAKNKYAKDIILQIGGDKKNRVLIVVDVQQCFFENFGTMGWLPKGYLDATADQQTNLNDFRDKVKIEFARRLNKFINVAKTDYDIIVFTKDRHPVGHRSFGTYPPHCIDKTKTCNFSYFQNKTKKKQETANIKGNTKKGYGHKLILAKPANSVKPANFVKLANSENSANSANSTDLEELTYDYKISYGGKITEDLDIQKLNKLDLIGKIKYETVIDRDTKNKTTTTDVNKLKITDKDTATIVRLNKGELCNFDAYGAFVYHVEYKESVMKDKARQFSDIYLAKYVFDPSGENNILHSLDDEIKDLSKISTGLGEFLLKYYGGNFAEDMVIDVCGLVTNICVVNSCIGGIKFFENVKARLQSGLNVPHFRILNEYSLYLYVFLPSEIDCLKKANISHKIYENDDEYQNDNQSRLIHSVSIIGTTAADGYTPNTAESNA